MKTISRYIIIKLVKTSLSVTRDERRKTHYTQGDEGDDDAHFALRTRRTASLKHRETMFWMQRSLPRKCISQMWRRFQTYRIQKNLSAAGAVPESPCGRWKMTPDDTGVPRREWRAQKCMLRGRAPKAASHYFHLFRRELPVCANTVTRRFGAHDVCVS